jgi:uncharacterized protein (TIGR02246 family)
LERGRSAAPAFCPHNFDDNDIRHFLLRFDHDDFFYPLQAHGRDGRQGHTGLVHGEFVNGKMKVSPRARKTSFILLCPPASFISCSQVAQSFLGRAAAGNTTGSTRMLQANNHVRSFHNSVFPTVIQLNSKLARSFSTVPTMTDDQVRGLFHLWNDALATLDAETVAKRYASKSILLPTVSDTPRTDYEGIKSYFTDFCLKMPQGVITESTVIKGDDWCMDAGVYEFTLGATGDKVLARYSFVYQYEDDEWKIAHHHSSMMPEAFLA